MEWRNFSVDLLERGIQLGFDSESELLRRSMGFEEVEIGLLADFPREKLNADLGDTLEDDCAVSVLGRSASTGLRGFALLIVPGTRERET